MYHMEIMALQLFWYNNQEAVIEKLIDNFWECGLVNVTKIL